MSIKEFNMGERPNEVPMQVAIIEDSTINLTVLCGIVGKMAGVKAHGFSDPVGALASLANQQADLLIVDYIMPGMNGIEFIRAARLLPGYANLPIVMITADVDRSTRLSAIDSGATDFLSKQVEPVELRARVGNLLRLRQAQLVVERRAEELANEVAAATRHLQLREEEIIHRLARAIEFRDNETSAHVGRVALVSRIIAENMGQSPEFSHTLYLAAPLHDVGKIGVPDAILNKPGKLDPAEMAAMRKHVDIGAQILADGDSDLVRMAAAVAAGHHEKWDGTGYPRGAAGTDIPLAARIAAVADVFDALCSPRCYKPAWPVNTARAEILRCVGSHFDPACIAAFEAGWAQIQPLYRETAAVSAA